MIVVTAAIVCAGIFMIYTSLPSNNEFKRLIMTIAICMGLLNLILVTTYILRSMP